MNDTTDNNLSAKELEVMLHMDKAMEEMLGAVETLENPPTMPTESINIEGHIHADTIAPKMLEALENLPDMPAELLDETTKGAAERGFHGEAQNLPNVKSDDMSPVPVR